MSRFTFSFADIRANGGSLKRRYSTGNAATGRERLARKLGMRRVETPTDGRTLVDYFLARDGMTVKVWFDHNTREWVAYLVDDDGNQIGYGVRERSFGETASNARHMTENAHEYLYDSERFHGMVEGGGLL